MPLPVRARLGPFALYLALGLALFGGLALAIHFFPRPYLWRTDVMSDLAEPRNNPHAYLIACASLALTGLLLLPFPSRLRPRLAAAAPATTLASGLSLSFAALTLIATGLVPGHIAGLGRTHEILGHIYGGALSLAMIGYTGAALRLPRRFHLQRLGGLALIVLPFGSFLASRLSVIAAYAFSSRADYLATRILPWNQLALWEWIAALGTYLFLGLLLTLPPAKTPPSS
jgi:hypothetical protein